MEVKIMWGAAIFFGGWLIFYLFGRQLCFNFAVAFRLIKQMKAMDKDLIGDGAKKYTVVSILVCAVILALVIFIVCRFCKQYLIISFFVGMLVCLLMLLPKLTPKCKTMYESFCNAYYRFVPDDELRTAMYNKDYEKMKLRLYEMNLSIDFIPSFKK